MRISIPSFRGHHEAVLDCPIIQEALFNKMTGKCSKALPAEYKTVFRKMENTQETPSTFEELSALWRDGTMSYLPMTAGAEPEIITTFNPAVEEIAYMPMIIGG